MQVNTANQTSINSQENLVGEKQATNTTNNAANLSGRTVSIISTDENENNTKNEKHKGIIETFAENHPNIYSAISSTPKVLAKLPEAIATVNSVLQLTTIATKVTTAELVGFTAAASSTFSALLAVATAANSVYNSTHNTGSSPESDSIEYYVENPDGSVWI